MADSELKILITANNQAKETLQQVLAQLAGIQGVLSAGFGGEGTAALVDGLTQVGQAAHASGEALQQSAGSSQQAGEAHAKLGEHAHEATGHLGGLLEAADKLKEGFAKVVEVTEFLLGGFAAIAGVRLLNELGEVSARAEGLAVAMEQVGKQSGYTAAELRETDETVQKLGISAEASRQALTRMMSNGVPPSYAEGFAKVANDLALISGGSTSATFTRLVQAVDSGNTTMLRRMGIVIDRMTVLQQATQQAGGALDQFQQKQVLANAVLAEAEKIQGVYAANQGTAAQLLGDVGDRVEKLKEQIGNALLPAYTAVLQVIADVVDATTEMVKAFNGGGEAASGLGDDTETAAHQASALAEAIRGVGAVLTTVIKFITENSQAFKDMIAFGAGMLAMKAAIPVLAAIGEGLGAITVTAAGATTAVGLLTGAMEALDAAMLANPVGAALIAAGVIAYGFYKTIGLINDASRGTVAGIEQQNTAVAAYRQSVAGVTAAYDTMSKANDAMVKAQNAVAVNRDAGKAEDLKKQAEDAKKVFEDAKDSYTKLSQAAADAEADAKKIGLDKAHQQQIGNIKQEVEDRIKATRNQIQAFIAFQNDLGRSGTDFATYSTGVSEKVSQAIRNIDDSLRNATHEGVNSGTAFVSVLDQIGQVASQIKTPEALKAFQYWVDKTRANGAQLPAALQQVIPQALAVAAEGVSKYQSTVEQGGAEAQARQRQFVEVQAKTLTDALDHEIALQKTYVQEDAALDKVRYEQGLLSLDQYYERRAQQIARNGAFEYAQQANAVLDAQAKLAQLYRDGAGAPQIAAQEGAVTAAQSRLSEVGARTSAQAVQQVLDQYHDELTKTQQVNAIVWQNMADHGNVLVAKIAEVNAKYDEQDKKLAGIGATNARLELAERRRLDVQKAAADASDTIYKRQVDLQSAVYSLEEARVGAANASGQITDVDAQERRNTLARERIALTEQQIDREKQALALAETPEEINKRTQSILTLQTQMETLSASIHNVGDDLRKTFVDGLASAFGDAAAGAEKWGTAMHNYLADIKKQITSTFAKNAVQSVFSGFTKGGDGQAGAFDNFGGLLTGSQPAARNKVELGSDESHKMFVQVVNLPKERADARAQAEQEAQNHPLPTAPTEAQLRAVGDAATAQTQTGGLQLLAQTAPMTPLAGVSPGGQPFNYGTAAALLGRQGTFQKPAYDAAFDTVAAAHPELAPYGGGDALRWLAGQESGFDANAVSGKGATGVMQIMPANFQSLGLTPQTATNPEANINAGATEFSRLLAKYHDPANAARAYNWGEGNMDAWLKTGKGADGKSPMPPETVNFGNALGSVLGRAQPPAPAAPPATVAAPTPTHMPTAAPQEPHVAAEAPAPAPAAPAVVHEYPAAPPPEPTPSVAHEYSGVVVQAQATERNTQALAENTTAHQDSATANEHAAAVMPGLPGLAAQPVIQPVVLPMPQAAPPQVPAVVPMPVPVSLPTSTGAGRQEPSGTSNDPVHVVQSSASGGSGGSAGGSSESGAPQTQRETADTTSGKNAFGFGTNGSAASNNPFRMPTQQEMDQSHQLPGAAGMLQNLSMAGGIMGGGLLGAMFGNGRGRTFAMRGGAALGLGASLLGQFGSTDTVKAVGGVIDTFFGTLKGKTTQGFQDMGAQASEGGMGISTLFGGLTTSVTSVFSSLGSVLGLASGGGGGSGGVGGVGGGSSASGGGGGGGIGGSGGSLLSLASTVSDLAVSGYNSAMSAYDQYQANTSALGTSTPDDLMSGYGHADGGLITGAGTGTSDSIHAMLSHGEYVMPARQTAMFGGMLESMRSGAFDHLAHSAPAVPSSRKYATGGYVSVPVSPTSVQQQAQAAPAPAVQLNVHPEALGMTMSSWLEGQLGRIAYTGG